MTASGMQNFIAIGSGISAPQIGNFAMPFGDYIRRFGAL